MSVLDTLVKINISQQTQAVQKASFSIPLIIGATNAGWADKVHSYTEPSEMLDDGFTTSSPEYIYALELFEQDVSPSIFYVGHRTARVAQVDTITPTAVNTHIYKVTINSTDFSYTSDGSATVAEIVAGLIALINADTSLPVTASGSTTLILTADVAGDGFSTSINADTNMVLVHTTANHGIADDLASIQAENDSWYGIALCAATDADIKQLAASVEALKKIFIACSADTDIPTAVTTDLLTYLKGKSYKRTALLYSETATDGKEAAWLGGQLPQTPGSNNWAYKTLVGISPDDLTATERTIVIGNPISGTAGKNGNVFTTVGGVNITQMGQMVGGQFIDITVGLDWLETELQTNIYADLVNSKKIPYTDKGTGILIAAVRAAIDQGVANGLIDGDSPITVTAPLVADVNANDRANRIAPTISFTCRLAGAFNSVLVSGTVTV